MPAKGGKKMTTFISPEFFIGNVLIALHRRDIPYISLADLRLVGRKFQDFCNKEDVDAVTVLSGDYLERALYENSDLFELLPNNLLRIRPGVTVGTLKSRFVGYLPFEVVCAMVLELPKFVKEVRVSAENQVTG